MDKELLRWLLPLGVAVLGFLLGGGWPAKAYRKWSDLQLIDRLKPHVWMRVEQEAFERHNNLRHDRGDETMELIRDIQRALTSLTGSVERALEAVKYANERLQDVESDVAELKHRDGHEA